MWTIILSIYGVSVILAWLLLRYTTIRDNVEEYVYETWHILAFIFFPATNTIFVLFSIVDVIINLLNIREFSWKKHILFIKDKSS